MFNNKKVAELERRVRKLEQCVERLEEKTEIEVELDYIPYFNPRISLKDAVISILSHLRAEFVFDRGGQSHIKKVK